MSVKTTMSMEAIEVKWGIEEMASVEILSVADVPRATLEAIWQALHNNLDEGKEMLRCILGDRVRWNVQA